MDMTSTCAELKAQLSDYIDGDLDARVCAELERHLADCDDCRIVIDTLRKTVLLYCNYSTPAMPAAAHERLMHVLKLDTVKPQQGTR